MNSDNLKIELVNYANLKHNRILEAVLTKWFQDPKDLQFTDPRMAYPFSFKKWVKLSYQQPNVETLVLKKDAWIIGHASILSIPSRRQKHIFHFFVDKASRGKGIGKLFLREILHQIEQDQAVLISLRVSPKNTAAIALYERAGFVVAGSTPNGSLSMEKVLT